MATSGRYWSLETMKHLRDFFSYCLVNVGSEGRAVAGRAALHTFAKFLFLPQQRQMAALNLQDDLAWFPPQLKQLA